VRGGDCGRPSPGTRLLVEPEPSPPLRGARAHRGSKMKTSRGRRFSASGRERFPLCRPLSATARRAKLPERDRYASWFHFLRGGAYDTIGRPWGGKQMDKLGSATLVIEEYRGWRRIARRGAQARGAAARWATRCLLGGATTHITEALLKNRPQFELAQRPRADLRHSRSPPFALGRCIPPCPVERPQRA